MNAKHGRPTDQRMAVIKNQASYLLWEGRIETTVAKAKSLRSYAEKIITLAMDSYLDVVKTKKPTVNAKGVTVEKTIIVDGPMKLAARRAIMAKVYDLHEVKTKGESKRSFTNRTKNINHPLVEKIFNEYAPKYAKRAKELGQRGGYTRILKLGPRSGDNAEMAIIELV